ncbi:MAG: GDP-mannose 4,6-dehydratase [Gordonia polyisoprenivorans]|nr:GDP-mannose 4,6-dehydratase [Gordonia polyisoprenivorans]
MTTALITGATGQDGSYLVERLLEDGVDVHAIVRGAVRESETALPESVVPHIADLGLPGTLAPVVAEVEPDVIVNLGGISSVAFSWDNPGATSRITGLGAVELMDAALELSERRGTSVRFVQASSAEIFGRAAQTPQNESTPLAPVSPYGIAKAFAHRMVSVYRQRGLLASAAILYNHESPRRPPTFVTRKVTLGVARIAAGLDSTLRLGNLDVVRDWGWAPDYVDAILRMLSAEPDDFVIATGVAHSVRAFVMAAFDAAGIDDGEDRIEIDERFFRPDDAPALIGDPSHARAVLGWAPTRDFREVVAAMVAADLSEVGR